MDVRRDTHSGTDEFETKDLTTAAGVVVALGIYLHPGRKYNGH